MCFRDKKNFVVFGRIFFLLTVVCDVTIRELYLLKGMACFPLFTEHREPARIKNSRTVCKNIYYI